MQNYKLAKDFLGHNKGEILEWNAYEGKYMLSGFCGAWFYRETIVENPDIFEPVLSLEDEIDNILVNFVHHYILNNHMIELDSKHNARNKIIKLFQDRK